MVIPMIAATKVAKWLLVAKIAIAVGPVFIAAQRVVDDHQRKNRNHSGGKAI